MKLVVVESPAKAKTINRYLGEDYVVKATMGHIKDLPKSKLAVDVENDYKTNYSVVKGKGKVIRELKKLVPSDHKDVYLALDPDREGEAIAAHVAEELKLKNPTRVVFHEITKDAILEAMNKPRKVDEDLVEAQKARRILDRLVGYKLSELLWKKIWYGLSAGRVQSVATRLIVERERERDAFKPEEFWKVFAYLSDTQKQELVAELRNKNGKKYVPSSQEEIDDLTKILEKSDWEVSSVTVKKKSQHAFPPFTTVTLQQNANNYLGLSAKRTMQLAQQIYQGVKIKGHGQIGLITYMRTDSTALAKQAVDSIRDLVGKKYGKQYLPDKPNFYKTKSRMAQEAHEAIRPAHFELSPESVKDSLNSQQFKLYKLIWDRAIASQMSPMQYDALKVEVEAKSKDLIYGFDLKANDVTFDGYAKVLGSSLLKKDELVQELDKVKEGEKLDLNKLDPQQNFTKPRARYSEATLVKTLEKLGIGRPSTYASIISTIQSRGYVNHEGKYLFPTDVGLVVNDFLVDHFSEIVDYDFTSEIEGDLDKVAGGDKDWVPVVKRVYEPLSDSIEKKQDQIKKEDVVILGDSKFKCPECGGKMVVRLGRHGRFLSCAKFPECKGMLNIDGKTLEETIDDKIYIIPKKCEKCEGKMEIKRGKYGTFWACENYPDCKFTLPMLLKEKCPECGEPLVERKGRWGKNFIGCSGYPDCKYIKKDPKKGKDGVKSVSKKKSSNRKGKSKKGSKSKKSKSTSKKRTTKSSKSAKSKTNKKK